eukprot:Gb_27381 [translate_table: standard]
MTLRKQKKNMVLFLEPMLLPHGRMTTTTALERQNNAKHKSFEDVRMLCKHGRLTEALHILNVLDQRVDSLTYICLLKACIKKKALTEGKLVHLHMRGKGLMSDLLLWNTLVEMYAKCGSLVEARQVFDEMPKRDVCTWTVMIAAYSKHRLAEKALTLFYQMQQTGIQPNQFTFASVLPACAHLADLEQGVEIHEGIIRSGFQCNVFVENALVDMYAKCENMEKARNVFDKMHQRNVVSWNSMIAGYTQNGRINEALNLFQKMPERDVVSWNSMIAGYAQNGHTDDALELFQKMSKPDVVSWNAMIAGYAENGNGKEALQLFEKMQLAGVKRNLKTFSSLLPICGNLAALEKGIKIHEDIIRSGIQSDVIVESALIDMYAKCGSIDKARAIFDKMHQRDVVSWNTMIAAYTRHGHSLEALSLFHQMQRTGIQPVQFTFTCVLPACADLAALEQGMEIHEQMIRGGFRSNVFVESALVDMYAKCGRIEKARSVFNEMHQRDVVSWNAMISGYALNGHGEEALKLFGQMQLVDVKPNAQTFAGVLPACANLAALEQGMEIHEDIIRSGFQSDVFVGSALVDMYAKCGSIEKARDIFDKMHQQNRISWTAMIGGYAMHGYGKEALQLFEQLQYSGINPDHVTLVCVLSACCHAGLVSEGWQYFDNMNKNYHITPAIEHYVCMVDLLGRAGRLDEAQDFIGKMPIKPDATVWKCLLGACRIHNNVELAECVAERLFELDPKNAAPYVLLSNIYAAAGRWDDIENVRRMMRDRRVKKTPGCSWIEVNKQMHAFLVGDKSHPQTEKIYAKLERLSRQMKAVGYLPDTRFVLRDVEEQQKEQILCHHSEKLAIVFGLINTSPGTTIRIIKNLRVCGDCHSATKFISKIVEREIVVRDANRYHHFKDGQCSCGDYW